LTAAGLPAVCIDARHAKAALDTAPNFTECRWSRLHVSEACPVPRC
jgi:hypothetical protein